MCPSGKRKYRTQELAAKALRVLEQRRQEGTIEDWCFANRAYYCDEHDAWHLTKKQLKRRPVPTDVLPGGY